MKKLTPAGWLLVLLTIAFSATSPAFGQSSVPKKKKTAVGKPKPSATNKGTGRAVDTARPVPVIIYDTAMVKPQATQLDTVSVLDSSEVHIDSTLAQVVVDSVKTKFKRKIRAPIIQVPVTTKSLILPGIFFTYGALALHSNHLRDVNREIKGVVWDRNPHERMRQYEDYTLLAPAVAVYVLNFAHFKGHNNIVDRSIMYGMANLINNGLSYGIKHFGLEMRPDSSNNQSFPSGHTSQAFVSAEFARLEYRGISPWPGIGGYLIAAGTGFLRMYNNHHWFSDVVAGAGVGIASTRFAYYIYPALKQKIFKARKIKGDAMFLPTYSPGGTYGFVFNYRFQ
jgi:hypothetical protein